MDYDNRTSLFTGAYLNHTTRSGIGVSIVGKIGDADAGLHIPLSVLIAGVFIIMERTGAANEDPFENKVTDVALSAICNTIERNLREMLGETELPPKLEVVDGYLF